MSLLKYCGHFDDKNSKGWWSMKYWIHLLQAWRGVMCRRHGMEETSSWTLSPVFMSPCHSWHIIIVSKDHNSPSPRTIFVLMTPKVAHRTWSYTFYGWRTEELRISTQSTTLLVVIGGVVKCRMFALPSYTFQVITSVLFIFNQILNLTFVDFNFNEEYFHSFFYWSPRFMLRYVTLL